MGVNLKPLISGKEVELKYLSGKRIAIDAFNWIYQFLSTIRLFDGSPLTNSRGEPTSHLNGLFFRTINLLENNIIPVYVFDGKPSKLKIRELERRRKEREEAMQKMLEATSEEEKLLYAKESTAINEGVIESAKRLLQLMGIQIVHAPEEGEAEAAYLNLKGKVDYVASQDYDSILFGAKELVRNLNIVGKRKLPGKMAYKEIKPEIVNSEEVYKLLGINREKIILIGMFLGTDFNDGVEGIGHKKALSIVKQGEVKEILKSYDFGCDDPEEVFNYFMNPPVEDVNIEGIKNMDKEGIIKFLVDENDFSRERVEEGLSRINRRGASLI